MTENLAHTINKGLFFLGIASVVGTLVAAVMLLATIGQVAIG